MASRIIHLAITSCISKSYRYKDKNRLELGSILPDAVTSGNGHLKICIANETKRTLVQDMFFRDFVYNCYYWNPLPLGNVERLHNDYALINQYVIQKYALLDTITIPATFDAEPLNELGVFTIQQFIADMKTDFQSCPTGTIFFFTREMADEFIAYASDKCEQEIDSLSNGLNCVDERMLIGGLI